MPNLSAVIPPTNLVTASTAQTLSNKTIASPVITGALTAGGSTGTSGQVLTSQGAGATPAWTTPSAGAMTLISTTTLASAAANVTFTGLIGYTQYLIKAVDVAGNVDMSTLYLRLSTTNGASWITSYSGGTMNAQPVGLNGVGFDGTGNHSALQLVQINQACSGEVLVYRGASRSYIMSNFVGRYNDGGSVGGQLASVGSYVSGAINAVMILFSAGTISAGATFKLYGIG